MFERFVTHHVIISGEDQILIIDERFKAAPQASGGIFYLFMSVLLAGIVVFGFSHTVPRDLAPPGLPLLLKFHAAVFVTWVLLFIAQPSLISSGNVTMHRRLGWFGLVLAGVMVAMGGAAIVFALRNNTVPPFYAHSLFLVRNTVSLAGFAGLVTAAVLRRRRTDWHRRLMLCATIAVIVPGLERAMPVFLFGPHWYVIVDAVAIGIALIGPAADLFVRRGLHPAYLYGVGTILLMQAVTDLISPTPFATALVRAVGGS